MGVAPANVIDRGRTCRVVAIVSVLGCTRTGDGPNVPPAPVGVPSASRLQRAPDFVCADQRCEQQFPRLPDDGDWSCAATAGVAICMGGERAAGVAPAAADPGWICGDLPRRPAHERRLCIDPSPDFPDGSPRNWRCLYRFEGAPVRVCNADTSVHGIGDDCSRRQPCVDGAICSGGHCALLRPAKFCWLDSDCDGGQCRLGGCDREGGTPVVPGESGIVSSGSPVGKDATGLCSASMRPLLDFGPAQAQIGYGRRFEIRALPGCEEAAAGSITWTSPDPAHLQTDERGFHVAGTTPPFAETLGESPPWGVIPISPRTRGRIRLHALWTSASGKRTWSTTVSVSAAARSAGLPNIAGGTRVFLGGTGWRLTARPDGSRAEVSPMEAAATLLPDMTGRFKLVDGGGRSLTLAVGDLDQTPLDCGRAGCHPSIVDSAANSPMTLAWKKLVDAPPGDPMIARHGGHGDFPRCAEGCHTTGEPGIADGGFSHTAARLTGLGVTAPHGNDSPRALRRLAGVGCFACHGPAAIPEPGARWAILRTGVCASCHDAPPTYGHVAAWNLNRMATSDRDVRARGEKACAVCHTTWGFLESLAAGRSASRNPPDRLLPTGVACAACHDPHPDAKPGAAPRHALLREVDLPAALDPLPPSAEPGRVCVRCHAPHSDTAPPSASAAAIWLGRGGVDPISGKPITAPTPHLAIAKGCIGCHGGSVAKHGANHAFHVDENVCKTCHAPHRAETSTVAQRATDLWARWVRRGYAQERGRGGIPLHAGRRISRPQRTGGPAPAVLDRATRNLLLVLEDPAARQHNGPFARLLLDSVEKVLDSTVDADQSGKRPHPPGGIRP